MNNNNERIEKFNGDWKKRLSKEEGKNIIHNGERLGESESDKDTYWSVYKLNEQYYITLNDEPDTVWLVSEEDAIKYYN